MRLVYTQKATANNNGYTMKKIVSLVGLMLKNAETFDEFMDAFNELEDDLTDTDFYIFFSTGDDFGFYGKDANNWYFTVENTHKKNEKMYNITKEIENMKD
jgi:hypothetical protein